MNNNKIKMLITGISGLLGNNLACYFRDKYEVSGTYNSHDVTIEGVYTHKCDFSNSDDIRNQISNNKNDKPDIIIHCASLTNIEDCEANKEYTEKINVGATRSISEAADKKDIKLIYISSDSVYDGVKGNFSENDKINPQNYYGLSKYLGELEVLKATNSLILRTNIFGWNIQEKTSLGEWVLKSLQERKTINGFNDAIFSSIYTFELARVIDIAIAKNLSGIFNCGASNSCSKYEFSNKLAEIFGFDKSLIKPISIHEYDFKAKRGKNLSLNVDKIQQALNYRLPSVGCSVDSFYRDFKIGLPEEIRKTDTERLSEPKNIQYGKQWIDSNDIRAVVNVLRDGPITQGPKVQEFENTLSGYCSAKYAVAVNSGTSGLHIACLAADVQGGDEVITSPITFVASANCAVYCGAKPIFADIDPEIYNVSPDEIKKKITEKTRAVIPVHFAGQSCYMESISAVVKAAEKKYGRKIYIIEDASHALGSLYKNIRVGSCAFSDMTVTSFHPVKHITTGEGGAVLSNDNALCKRLKRFRSHGITNDTKEFVNKDLAFQPSAFSLQLSPTPWYYEQIDLGYNYRITDIQCALGISQMKRLDEFRRRRREIVNIYNEAFADLKYIRRPFEASYNDSNFHLYVVQIDFPGIAMDRTKFMTELKGKGILTQVHYIPVHLQPYFRIKFGTAAGDCPVSENYYQQCLSLPLYPAMNQQDVNSVVTAIRQLILAD
jgi:UDP-4-amino-4,6-dideoxy-N-acetyl-beta-L-altrosamine transaminase/dTDP-4-dehydrorhamnose reductase